MHLDWVKDYQNNYWYDLLKLDLFSQYFINLYGIYVIWYVAATGSKVIKIGYGMIGEKLRIEKQNQEVIKYSSLGQLKVTWAVCNELSVPGVLSFLYNIYTPILGESAPVGATPIVVNLVGQ